jgi:hypothetical protein
MKMSVHRRLYLDVCTSQQNLKPKKRIIAMAITSTQQQLILKLTAGMFNASAGGYMTELSNMLVANNGNVQAMAVQLGNTAAFKSAYPSYLTGDQFADNYLATVLSGYTAATAVSNTNFAWAKSWVAGKYNAGQSVGSIVYDVVSALDGVATTDATWGNSKKMLDNKTTAASTYTITNAGTSTDLTALKATVSSVTSDVATVTAAASTTTTGSTFTLTTGSDNITGTSSNDTLNGALVDYQTQANSNLGSTDTIALGAGTDTMNITTQGTTAVANILNNSIVTGVETINVRSLSTNGTADALDANNVAGLTTINANLSTQGLTVTNLVTGAVATMTGNGSVTNGALSFGYKTASDAATLNVTGGTTAGAVAITSTPAAVTINSTGANNTIGTLNVGGSATGLTINASTGLITGALTGAALATITVTGAASSSSPVTPAANDITSAVQIGALSAAVTTIDASAMTAGGASVTLIAGITSFKGGAGVDTVTTSAAALTSTAASIIDAGAGTDVLRLGAAADINTATLAKQYANFETFDTMAITGSTIDMSLFTNSTITAIREGGGTAEGLSNVTATQAANVTIYANQATTTTIALKDATTNGNIDTLAITISDGLAAKNTITLADVVAVGTEKINFTAVDNLTVTSLVGSTSFNSSVITGAGNVSLTTGALAITANTTVDASAVTGTFTFSDTAGTANGVKVTGSATGVNTFTGSVTSTIADWFIGGSAADTFTNNVTGQATTGGDTFTGGLGADTFVLRGNVASGVASTIYATATKITDFTVGTGGDILSLSTTAVNYTAGTGLGNSYMAATTAVAAGSTVITTLGSTSVGATITAGTSLVKLSNGVAESASLQTMFNAAIGTSTFTVTTGTEGFFSLYDTTNSKMVVGLVDAGAGTATAVETGDVVTLIGTLNMSAADYALFSAQNLSLVVA